MMKLISFVTMSVGLVGLAVGGIGFWITAVSLSGLVLFIVIRRYAYIRIPEMEVGVLINHERQAFVRFLPPGRHWINPLAEKMTHTIPTGSGSAAAACAGVQAIGGISLNIEWSLAYNLNPFKIESKSRPKLASKLPHKADLIAVKHMNNCLRHIVGEYTIDELCQPGVHKRLERKVRQLAAERLASLGFELSRVMIGAIEMPAHVKTALEAAQERAWQTANEVKALQQLQQVVSQFSDADMQRLIELERIHVLGQNGVALMYPTAVSANNSNDQTTPAYTHLPEVKLSRS
jgi:hypothetical protein